MRIVIEIDDSKAAADGRLLPSPTTVTFEPPRSAPADAAPTAEASPDPTVVNAGAAPEDLALAAAPQAPRELLARAAALQALNAGPAPSLEAAAAGPATDAAPPPAARQAARSAVEKTGAAAAPPSGTFTNAGAARAV